MNRHLLAEVVDESDVVYHLAAAVGVRRIIESPVRTIETNVKGTELVSGSRRQEAEAGFHRLHLRSLWQEQQSPVL